MELIFLCIKIFLVRIIDVSLGTIRTVLTVKDKIVLASTIGFFEVLVWFLIVKDALNSTNNSILIAISYALGFATGTYVGGFLAKIFTGRGTLSVQIVINNEDQELIDVLHKRGYAVSVMQVSGYHEASKLLLFLEIDSSLLNGLRKIVNTVNDKAFVVVSDSKAVYNGYFAGVNK